MLATIAIAVLVILVDQATKEIMVDLLIGEGGTGRIDLISDWLGFSYVENRGAAFGILQGRPEVLLVLAILIVIGIATLHQRIVGSSMLVSVAIGLILGGALGNIMDRIRLGFVVDFVAVGPFPRFNVADSSLTVGVVLFAGAMLFSGEPGRPEQEARREGMERLSE